EQIEAGTGLETRKTILGYIQRGGSPSPMDRILATRFGASAVDLIAKDLYGKMVIKKGEKIGSTELSKVAGKTRLVPPNHAMVEKARGLDICLGNKK
ncbi:MAG: 6-phosphofructokinase, partial [Bacteroidetes bacterium CG_4_9_14_3_um_filter_41_19]